MDFWSSFAHFLSIIIVVCIVDEDEKWRCFVCNPEPLLHLSQTCSQFISQHLKLSRGAHSVKRRKSASNVMYVPQKRQKTATIINVTPPLQKHDREKPATIRGRLGISPLPKFTNLDSNLSGNMNSAVNGGVVTIHRPEYDADMIPVNEHNVWPVLEKLLAATQSMSMLLGSLKDDLQRSSAQAARMTDVAVSHIPSSNIALKRREAALKLWRAFDAYQKSFVDIETYSQETSKIVQSSEVVSGSNSASVTDGDQPSTSAQLPVDK